jgi:hypothetical protein
MRVVAREVLVAFERIEDDWTERDQRACDDWRPPSECVPIAT